jgi:hypothetical protein
MEMGKNTGYKYLSGLLIIGMILFLFGCGDSNIRQTYQKGINYGENRFDSAESAASAAADEGFDPEDPANYQYSASSTGGPSDISEDLPSQLDTSFAEI